MDDIIEFFLNILYHFSFLEDLFPNDNNRNRKVKLEPYSYHESYVIGTFATAIAVCFEDDQKLDKKERRLIIKLFRKVPYKLSRESKKYIKTLIQNKLNFNELKRVYQNRRLKHNTIMVILDELERAFRKNSMSKNIVLIQNLRKGYFEK